MFNSSYSPDAGLVEILDNSLKPLCLIPAQEAATQPVICREIAVLAKAGPDSLLLCDLPDSTFGITCKSLLQAGKGRAEYAGELAEACLGFSGQITEITTLRHGLRPVSVFYAVYSKAMLKAIAPPGFTFARVDELDDLSGRGLLDSLLLKIAPFIKPWKAKPSFPDEQGHS